MGQSSSSFSNGKEETTSHIAIWLGIGKFANGGRYTTPRPIITGGVKKNSSQTPKL
ncbi:MAG: hypothetical protein K2P54_03095 [Odoribacter sp.]|nr:hypothetical protein [Odoribacter sp.]